MSFVDSPLICETGSRIIVRTLLMGIPQSAIRNPQLLDHSLTVASLTGGWRSAFSPVLSI